MTDMNTYYKREIIQRFMIDEEFAAFDRKYRDSRVPKVFCAWGTDKDRDNYIKQIEKLNKICQT